MLIKLNHVKEARLKEGRILKSYVFKVDENREICIDTEGDNSINVIFLEDKRRKTGDVVVGMFISSGLCYIENLMSGIYLDEKKITAYDHMFRDTDEVVAYEV